MILDSVEYREQDSIIYMWAEKEYGPFDEYIIGCFKKGEEDGYFRFHPYLDVIMTCNQLKRAAQKTSDLNSDI